MKKTLLAIFAHPDDEAFGPGGTIAIAAKTKNVYLICVTNGDWNGTRTDPELGALRKNELLAASNQLGVKQVYFLEYPDGSLNNNLYHSIAERINGIVKKLHPSIVITLEPHGVSGHLDHIAVSMITSFVFSNVSYIDELWYFCISDIFNKFVTNYFVYFPPGYAKEDIDKIVDVSAVWNTKIEAMNHHHSQQKDIDMISKALSFIPQEEYFLVLKRTKVKTK